MKRLRVAVLWEQENKCPKNQSEPTAKASHFGPPRRHCVSTHGSIAVRKLTCEKVARLHKRLARDYSGSQSRVKRCENQEEKVRVPFPALIVTGFSHGAPRGQALVMSRADTIG
jgi:hypothetical protein